MKSTIMQTIIQLNEQAQSTTMETFTKHRLEPKFCLVFLPEPPKISPIFLFFILVSNLLSVSAVEQFECSIRVYLSFGAF